MSRALQRLLVADAECGAGRDAEGHVLFGVLVTIKNLSNQQLGLQGEGPARRGARSLRGTRR